MWVNWSGGQFCAPQVVESPKSSEQVAEAIARAAAAGRTLRVAGAGHSFSDAAVTNDTQ